MLLASYAEAAAAHGEASETGDYRKANANHTIVASTYRELRSRGLSTQRSLLSLLNHQNDGVRGWAAAHALEFSPEEGEPVLKALAETNSGIIGLDAILTLEEWHKGRLRFP